MSLQSWEMSLQSWEMSLQSWEMSLQSWEMSLQVGRCHYKVGRCHYKVGRCHYKVGRCHIVHKINWWLCTKLGRSHEKHWNPYIDLGTIILRSTTVLRYIGNIKISYISIILLHFSPVLRYIGKICVVFPMLRVVIVLLRLGSWLLVSRVPFSWCSLNCTRYMS